MAPNDVQFLEGNRRKIEAQLQQKGRLKEAREKGPGVVVAKEEKNRQSFIENGIQVT